MIAFRDVAPRLVANGYLPLPVRARGKEPVPDGWRSYRLQPGDADRYAQCSAGIICGAVAAADIDVLHDDLAARLEALAVQRLGVAPRRIGRAPKTLLLYRTVAPFAKLQTRGYRLPEDAPEDKAHKVEILADGQQFVAYGVHPTTGRPYTWNGAGDPLDVPAADLPTIDEAVARAFIREADELLAEYGEPTGRLRDEDNNRPHEPNEKQRGDPQVIRSALQAIPNADQDYDDWLYIGLAIKGALGEDGLGLWREFSARSRKNDPAETDRAWRSLAPKRIGAGTLIFFARKHGWQAPGHAALAIDPKAPLAMARLFKRELFTLDGMPTLHYWQGEFYKYRGSAYASTDTTAVRGSLYPFLDSCTSVRGEAIKPTRRIVDDVQDALRATSHLDVPSIPSWLGGQAPYPLADLIPCANGIVHVPSRKLLAPTPALFNVNATTFDFDPKAARPRAWLEFIASIFGPDVQAIFALQEFFGLALTTDTSYQKALLIVGPKRSGKGTIARVLTALLGPANTGAPTLAGLGGPFGLQSLIGKQLAIVSDARLGGRADIHAVTENLLRITGEDFIGVPRKFLSDYTARLPVRFIVMTNEVPALSDSSGALPSRFIVLRLTRTFYGAEDTRLTDKLLTELPGVFLWALEGLERLRDRGAFLQPASGQAMLDQLDELASPIKAFLRERCIVATGASIECGYLFQQWQEWCRESNREHPGTVQTFGRNLSAAVPGLQISQPRIDGQRMRHYAGIRLRSAADPE